MDDLPAADPIDVLRSYAARRLGTRDAIERAGFDDYADLFVAMVQSDLDFPRPASSPARDTNIARASAILQPRLRNGRSHGVFPDERSEDPEPGSFDAAE